MFMYFLMNEFPYARVTLLINNFYVKAYIVVIISVTNNLSSVLSTHNKFK